MVLGAPLDSQFANPRGGGCGEYRECCLAACPICPTDGRSCPCIRPRISRASTAAACAWLDHELSSLDVDEKFNLDLSSEPPICQKEASGGFAIPLPAPDGPIE